MAKKWLEVIDNPEFQNLSDDEKSEARDEYYNTIVSANPEFQQLQDFEKEEAKNEFYNLPLINEKNQSIFSKAKDIAKTAYDYGTVPGLTAKISNEILGKLKEKDEFGQSRGERLAKNYGKGVLGTASGVGGALKAMGAKTTGKAITDLTENLEKKYLDIKGEPEFIDYVASGLGSATTFLIPGVGVSKGAKALSFAPKLAAFLGAGTMATTEAMVEGGATYEESIKRGLTEEQARKNAGKTFFANIPTNFILDKWMFGKIPEGKQLKQVLSGGSQEAVQEYLQSMISTWSIGDDIFTKEAQKEGLTSAAVGGIVGGGIGVGKVAKETFEQPSIAEKEINGKDWVPLSFPDLEVTKKIEPLQPEELKKLETKKTKKIPKEAFRETKKIVPSKIEEVKIEKPEKLIEEPTPKIQKLSAQAWGKDLQTAKTTEEKVVKSKIIKHVEDKFKVPVRGKVTERVKNVAGWYKNYSEVIRQKKWGELEVLSHETAHHIDKQLGKIDKYWKNKLPKEIKQELEQLDYQPEKGRLNEGFAEFIRHYTSTNQAREKAPKFNEYFEKNFKEKNPEEFKNLKELKDLMQIWYKQGSEERVLAQIDFAGETMPKPLIKEKIRDVKDTLKKDWIDEFAPIQKIEKEIEKKTGKKLLPSKSPTELATATKVKQKAIANYMINEAMVDETGNVIGKSLGEALAPVVKDIKSFSPAKSEEMKQFLSYGVAKRAIDLKNRKIESGIDIKDAEFIVKKYKNEKWDKALNDITEWSNQLLDWVVRAGGLSKEATERIRDLNPIYLPFKRVFVDEMKTLKGVKGSTVKAIKGSGRPIINPLESLANMAQTYVGRANKMRVVNAILELSKEEGVGGIIDKVARPIKPISINKSEVYKKVFNEIFGENKELLDKVTQTLKDGDMTTEDEFLTFFMQDNKYTGADNVVVVWRNGKPEFYEVNKELYDALQGIEDYQHTPILQFLGKFSRLKRLGAIQLRGSFAVLNAIRDFWTFSITSKKTLPTPLDPILGVFKDLLNTKSAQRYKAMGGEMSTMMGYDRNSSMKFLDEMLLRQKGFAGKTLLVAKHPINALRSIIGVTEMGARVEEFESLYNKYIKQGMSDDDASIKAFNDAQDVTINFSRAGKRARGFNQMTAFFNAGIQGIDKVYRTATENPVRFVARGIAYITLPALYFWNDNKDKEWFKNMPLPYKYSNIFVEVGNKVMRVPLPFDIGVLFGGGVMSLLDSFYNKDPKAIKEWLKTITKNITPSILPDVISPVWDVAKNKNWLDQPIETMGMQYKLKKDRYKYYTTKLAKLISNTLYKLGMKDFLSPVQLDYLADQYTGGFMSSSIRALNGVKERTAEDMPFIGRMILKMPERPSRLINDFWERKEYLNKKKNSDFISGKENAERKIYDKVYRQYIKPLNKVVKRANEEKNKKVLRKVYIEIGKKIKYMNRKLYKKEFVDV